MPYLTDRMCYFAVFVLMDGTKAKTKRMKLTRRGGVSSGASKGGCLSCRSLSVSGRAAKTFAGSRAGKL